MLTPQEAFLKAILEQPDDDAPRLMYADWLEEKCDPRGEFIRVQCQLAQTAKGAPGWKRLRQRERELLDQHGAEWGGLLSLRLRHRSPLFRRGLPRPEMCRKAASGGGVRSPDAVLSTLGRSAEDPHLYEFVACVVQEVVMKEGEVTDPAAVRFADKMAEMGHPLARLPLYRLEIESQPSATLVPSPDEPPPERRRPSRRTRPPEGTPYPLPDRGHEGVSFREVTAPGEARRIATAVLNWEKESNGQWEAGVFRSSSRLALDRLSLDVFQALPPEVPRTLTTNVTPAGLAWGALFHAASAGGAYNNGRGNAYGRLDAWESFAALMGSGLHEKLETLAKLAAECRWLTFDTDWFCDIAWDLGLIVVRPDATTVAVLAATDTD
jgi:uncharacterized protein (TIGR02996 family)